MRYIILVIFCAASICLSQETYYNDELGFTIDIPSNWKTSLENEWPVEFKAYLERRSVTKALVMLNPIGVDAPSSPCIRIFGRSEATKGTSKSSNMVDSYIKQNGKSMLTSHMKRIANEVLGDNVRQFRKVDTFYEYSPSKRYAIANMLYKKSDGNTFFMVTTAKTLGQRHRLNIEGYWTGIDHEEFWQVFTEVVDSCKFGLTAKPKEVITEAIDSVKIDPDAEPKEEALRLIWKWAGIILTISIVLGIVKWMYGRA